MQQSDAAVARRAASVSVVQQSDARHHAVLKETKKATKKPPTPGHPAAREEVLCILRNATKESFSVHVAARTPGGKSFLSGCDVDLEPGGHVAFVSAAADEVQVSTGFACYSLQFAGGRPSLVPGEGLRQAHRRTATAGEGVPPWVLTCAIWSTSQTLAICVSPHADMSSLLSALPHHMAFQRVWAARQPAWAEERTLLAIQDQTLGEDLEGAIGEFGLEHFVIPSAIFVPTEGVGGGGESALTLEALDGGAVQLRTSNSKLFVVLAKGSAWPEITLVGERTAHRAVSRWDLCYSLERIL